MKFSCETQTLAQKLSAVSHAVSSKASLPVLSHILLEAGEGKITLSATNLEISIKTFLPAEIKEPGSTCVPGRILLDLVSSLPHGALEVSENNNMISFKNNKANSKINSINASEFPKIEVQGEPLFEIDPKEFTRDLQRVSFSTAGDESRPILTGILMEANKEGLTLVGVDGFRLSEKKLPLKLERGFKEVIPAKALMEVARLLGSEEKLSILYSKEESQIVFKSANVEVYSRLLEGSFPDYKKIIPEGFVTKAQIDLDEFREALKVVSVFARDSSSIVKIILTPEKSQMVLSATASEVGENESEVFAKIEGEAAEISFNAKYLNDCLANIDGEEVEFKVTGALTPGIFIPVGKTDYLHLIMPVRVQS